MEVRFTVPGPPVPKLRPRYARTITGELVVYALDKVVHYKNWVRLCAEKVKPEQLLDGPLALEVTFYFRRPKKVPKGQEFQDRKLDAGNLLKILEDALGGGKNSRRIGGEP